MATTGQQITVHCSSCGKKYQLPLSARGKSAKCGCGHRFVVEPASNGQAAAQTVAPTSDDTKVVSAPPCVNHASNSAIASCLKCNSPICSQCALRTKSGKYVCRPCAEKHAAAAKPVPPASNMLPTEQATRSPEPASEGDFIEIPPGALTPLPDLPAPQNVHQHAAAGPVMAATPAFGHGTQYAAGPYQTTAPGAMCAQHPRSPVAGYCMICRKPVCGTCQFVFPSNLMCCPECAANTDYPISPHRKIMIYASLGCAVFATLVMALLCSGLLSFLGDGIFADVVLEAIVIVPLCLGIGLGFGSWNKQEGNPALLWAGGIWNSLGLAAWLLFLALLTLSNLAGG